MTENLNEMIRNHAMLVTYSTSTWTAVQNDRSLARKIEQDTHATAGSMKLSKNLMAGHDHKLEAVRSVLNEARVSHNALTLPWGNSKMRMMPVLNFERYTETMAGYQHAFKAALDKACETYPVDAVKAREGLGIPATYHSTLYPTVEAMKAMWSFKLHFEPIAESARFPGLPDSVTEALASRFEAQIGHKYDQAINEHLLAMRGLCDGLLANLAQDRPTFKDAAVFNIVQMAVGLKRFNVMRDEALAGLAEHVNHTLSHWSEVSLKDFRKKDKSERSDPQVLIDEVTNCRVNIDLLLTDRGYSE